MWPVLLLDYCFYISEMNTYELVGCFSVFAFLCDKNIPENEPSEISIEYFGGRENVKVASYRPRFLRKGEKK